MEKTIVVFTIFTFFLFTVTTARIALDPVTESVAVTDSDVTLPESDETQTFVVRTIDQSPRLIFARPHPIMRHFYDKTSRIPLRFVKRQPCRKFQKTVMIPRSYGNDAIVSSKTYSFDTETISDDQIPKKWLEFKHSHGHRLHHEHHDKEEEHKEKKREHKGGFVRGIRKFLKNTFD